MAVAGAPLGRSLSVMITKKDYFRSAQDKVPALTDEESEKAQLGQTQGARARFGACFEASSADTGRCSVPADLLGR